MSITYSDAVKKIVYLNTQLTEFWSSSQGWAPLSASEMLTKSRLDWQVSLSETMHLWSENSGKPMSSGELILAWANLGSLVEGTIKLFLSVHYEDYLSDIDTLTELKLYDPQKNKLTEPDGLALEKLRLYCQRKDLIEEKYLQFILLVQQRRNAIHAFKNREIGNREVFEEAVGNYLSFIKYVIAHLPYPDSHYIPKVSD